MSSKPRARFLLLFALLFFITDSTLAQRKRLPHSNNYIGWRDMKAVSRSMIKRQDINRGAEALNRSSGIIIVDTNAGDSPTVQGAVNMVPENNKRRVKILISPGIYREKVIVPASKPYISFIGQENRPNETVISWNNKASDKDRFGNELGTYSSGTVTIESDYFCAVGMTIQNTMVAEAGQKGMQAVALRIAGDKAMLYKVRVLGTQDTLLDDMGTHYFLRCHIQGSVDFIFGQARSLYRECVIESTAETYGAIAAHHRDSPYENTGFSFVNCVINGTGNIYLGRAWGNYSRAIYSYSYIEGIIINGGWSDWNVPSRHQTVEFGQYKCMGKGADTTTWVPWSKSLSFEEASPFLNMSFIEADKWLRL